MAQIQFKYLKSADNHSFYKVNITERSIIRICNNKRTFPVYETVVQTDLVKMSKNDWNKVNNTYYNSQGVEEWQFEGKWYRSAGFVSDNVEIIKFGCRIINMDLLLPSPTGSGHEFLVYHHGSVWSAYISGNYYPRLPLSRLNKNGEVIRKWTNASNCRNIEHL